MATVARGFWSVTWAPRANGPTDEEISNHIQGYTPKIPIELSPIIPDIDSIINSILATSDSSPGPDGIPFAFYRLFVEEISPIIQNCIVCLAKGEPPPTGFNWGILHLFPKNGSDIISNTRPISVANCDNRIIAKIMAELLYPIADEIIHPCQKGFIPGRTGSDHIRLLNRLFYENDGDPTNPTYVLLLDNMKAFDSVDHKYIFAILNQIGLPDWVITVIKSLFNDIRVTPMVGRGKGGWISILRGVKQGCPLSPLLFVLIYDTYIRRLLQKMPQAEDEQICAFADDLMQITKQLENFNHTTNEIALFETVAGCSVHKGKSAFICNRPNDPNLHNWVANSSWPASVIRDKGTYLGVLFGNNITTNDIFFAPMNKFRKRLNSYRPILRRF